VQNINVIPKPVQKPHPPVYMAAISPDSFTIAAERGLQLMVTPTLMSLDELKQNVLVAKRELAKMGVDPLTLDFPMNWQMHIADSAEAAKRDTADAFGWYFEKVMSLVPQGANTPPSYERYAELAANFKAQGTVDVEILREQGIVLLDNPEGAIRAIETLHRDIGQQQILCWMRIGGLEHEKVMSSMKRFAEEVIPATRDLGPVVPEGVNAA
jgi:alkanesulfonate monooxygenase SsuD/methylene tetrahydromethanopterin reductase-like flavin-dependent oxidoreductase (luciferase family)